jgi:3-phenylpropionate/cinnamic acid dioxygenase small subunit
VESDIATGEAVEQPGKWERKKEAEIKVLVADNQVKLEQRIPSARSAMRAK